MLVTFVHIPAWYLFYDLFAMFDAFTLRKNFRHLSWGRQLWLYITKKSGLVSHHIILFLFGHLLVAVSDNMYMCRESFHGTKELFNLPPLVLKARHLCGSAFC
jgi:Na+/proline symporter